MHFIFYSSIFAEVTDPGQVILRDKALKKVGLKFEKDLIQIEDEELWKSVSMINRIQSKMPSTTNLLEAFHGQINQQTPRRNNFWKAFYKLAMHFNRKAQNIQDTINHNYLYEKRATLRHGICLHEERMNQQISEYHTTPTSCQCGGNKLLSSIMNIDFPCAHRVQMGAEFPECPEVNISVKNQWDTLVDKYNPSEADPTITKFYVETSDKIYAVEMIRCFSMCRSLKKRKVIEEYVDENYQVPKNDFFINDNPSSLLRLIHSGIQFCNNLKQMKNEKKVNIILFIKD